MTIYNRTICLLNSFSYVTDLLQIEEINNNIDSLTRAIISKTSEQFKQLSYLYFPACLHARLFHVSSKVSSFIKAAEEGDLNKVQQLIKAGVDPSSRNINGSTAIMYAAQAGHLDVVKFLVTQPGVDPSFRKKNGMTAFMYAVNSGHFNVVRFLATQPGFDPSSKDNFTALMYAAREEHHDIVQFLATQSGVGLSSKSNNGSTTLYQIKNLPNKNTIKSFLETFGYIFNPKEIAYEQWFRGWKEIAHILEFPEQLRVDGKKITLEGSGVYYFARKITESLNKMADESPEWESSTVVKSTAEALEFFGRSPEDCFQRWQSDKLVIISTADQEHATCTLIYKDVLIYCDLSGKYKPYQVFDFEKILLTLPIFKKMWMRKKEIISEILEDLNCWEGRFKKTLDSLNIRPQNIGNCAWASLEASVLAAFIMLALKRTANLHLAIPSVNEFTTGLSEETIKTIVDQQQKAFKQWKQAHQKWRIEKHHRLLKCLGDTVYPNWQISKITVLKIRRLWQKYSLEQIPVPTISLQNDLLSFYNNLKMYLKV